MTNPTPPSSDNPSPSPLRSAIVTSVNWERTLEFTHLFRGFHLAINPAKLLIALAATGHAALHFGSTSSGS